MRRIALISGFLCALITNVTRAEEEKFRPLFNGKDLTGWARVNCAPKTFTVKDEMIVSTGVPTGFIRSDRHYENFILELEWRHMKEGGNAGVFVWGHPLPVIGEPFARGIEVQILDGRNNPAIYTSHGDVFPIQGATMKPDRPHPGGPGAMRCLPSEWRCKPSPEWNHYRVTCKDGAVKLEVNGKEVSGGSESSLQRGYICLESEGSECHFRNIRIHELPASDPPPKGIAPLDEGFKSLYTGVDLSGWKLSDEQAKHWRTKDYQFGFDGVNSAEGVLRSEKEYKDFQLMCDFRLSGKPEELAEGASDSAIIVRGDAKHAILVGGAKGSGGIEGVAEPSENLPPAHYGWRRLLITVRGDTISVDVNDKRVVNETRIEGIPASGFIGFSERGRPVHFMNVFVREI